MRYDWFSLNFRGIFISPTLYTEKKRDISSRIFNNISDIYLNGNLLCTVASVPKSPVLPKYLVQVKFSNYYLYHAEFKSEVERFIQLTGLEFIGVSRIDICHDFESFKYNLHPHTFISNIFKNKYLHAGKSHFSANGRTGQNIEFEYFKIGANTSNIVCYLYNKTRELECVKNKPYIRRAWELSGIGNKSNVWRLEVSIKGNTFKLLSQLTGEFITFDFNRLFDQLFIDNVYIAAIDKYFKFYYNDNKSKKQRNRVIELFSFINSDFYLAELTSEQDSTRSDKIFINKCLKVFDELREVNREEAEQYMNIAKDQTARKGLHKFTERKLINLKLENYV